MRSIRTSIISRPVLWILLSAAYALLVLLCIAWVDLPLADCAQAAFGTPLFGVAIAILTILHAMLVPMALFVVGCGAWRLAGRRLPDWAGPFVKAILAAGVAVVITLALKVAIGRSQAYPHYIQITSMNFAHSELTTATVRFLQELWRSPARFSRFSAWSLPVAAGLPERRSPLSRPV